MDKALKQRLVGAAILIALAVIFVPIWVGSPDPREAHGDPIDLPEPAVADREVRRLPLGELRVPREEPAEPAAERLSEDLPDPEASAGEPATETLPEPVPAGAETPAEPPVEAAGPPVETSPPERTEGDWLVQVASFGNANAAGQLSGRLEALGYSVVTDTVIRGETRLHRVRAGPFSERADAELALTRIGSQISGVQPTVVNIGGETPGQAAEPVAAGRYAVQVGVFARQENAAQLRERLESRGFTAFVDSESAGGRTTWKVRAGPVLERAEAEQLRDRLRTEANVEGMIVGHP